MAVVGLVEGDHRKPVRAGLVETNNGLNWRKRKERVTRGVVEEGASEKCRKGTSPGWQRNYIISFDYRKERNTYRET